MDLLLNLIEAEKMDVTRLSLARVTDQYLEYLEQQSNITLGQLAEFLTVAAKLILIKSKALLPLLVVSEEEEEEIADLALQLEQYKKFKEASVVLGATLRLGQVAFSRESFQGLDIFYCPPKGVTAETLKDAFGRVLGEILVIEQLEERVVGDVIALEEKISHLQSVIRKKVETSFAEVVAGAEDKVEVIVSFLAMLELVKQRLIHVEQDEVFSDIRMKHNSSAGN